MNLQFLPVIKKKTPLLIQGSQDMVHQTNSQSHIYKPCSSSVQPFEANKGIIVELDIGELWVQCGNIVELVIASGRAHTTEKPTQI